MWGFVCLRVPVIAIFGFVALAGAQTTVEQSSRSLNELLRQVQELRVALQEMRSESQQLRRELDATRQQMAEIRTSLAVSNGTAAENKEIPQTESQQLTDAKLNDLDQTRIASGSRYRVRLSGLALFNAASTRGAVDQVDLPLIAQPGSLGISAGSLTATVRQSRVSLEVFGPDWKGAKTAGELTVDFLGGFPSTPEGVTSGLLRLRTAKMTLDWKNNSVLVGQDALFFSPRSPTSLASSAYPALSYSGNLWTWTPQVAVEHRWNLSDRSKVMITGGLLDPLTGELPGSEYDRMATAGERSRIPAVATRLGWQRTAYDGFASLGGGVYYSRQRWVTGQNIDSWAAMTDWELPLGPWFWLTGKVYRGRAIAGLGGGANGSVLFTNPGSVIPIDSAGGWIQLKFKPAQKVELNGALGGDHAFLSESWRPLFDPPVRRNESGMFNVIYQPRSNLVFSVEYRRLHTVWPSGPATADHVTLAAGVLF